MPTYIAMLRGINVSGHNIVKMERLRASFESLKAREVRTYVQSGNVVFQLAAHPPAPLARRIEARLLRDFGFSVAVLLRTARDLKSLTTNNPFLRTTSIDPSKLHVTFLSEAPGKAAVLKLDALATGPDRFHVAGREIYLHCPEGYGRTKLSNTAFERILSVSATTRNWKTVNALLELAGG